MIDSFHNQLLATEAGKRLQLFSNVLIDRLKPPPGTYGLFNHISQALGRVKDCEYIVKRLYEGREKLNMIEIDKNLSESDKQSLETDTNQYMQLDFEALYVFGGTLLDQWAIISLYISGDKKPKDYKHPFQQIVTEFDKGDKNRIFNIWLNCKPLMLWLYYQVRFYRNKFVIHSEKPWQRGPFWSVYGEDYCLSIPSPPGWLDEEIIKSEIKEIYHLVPDSIKKLPEGHGSKQPLFIIEPLFKNICDIQNREDREKVARIFGKVGGSTPSFQIVAEKIFTFIILGTELLIKIACEDIALVNIGKSKEK